MPPRITYDTTGLTAGTEINFTWHPEKMTIALRTKNNRNESDDGTWETVTRFTEKEWKVQYNSVTQSERTSYETFFTTWAGQGKSFLFWPTSANESTYYTVKLKEKEFLPDRFAVNTTDVYKFTHTYRLVVS
jgi:hypothetical protein